MIGLTCAKCRCSVDEKSAVWYTADGSRRRSRPVCGACNEAAVRGLGRSAIRGRGTTEAAGPRHCEGGSLDNAVRAVEEDR